MKDLVEQINANIDTLIPQVYVIKYEPTPEMFGAIPDRVFDSLLLRCDVPGKPDVVNKMKINPKPDCLMLWLDNGRLPSGNKKQAGIRLDKIAAMQLRDYLSDWLVNQK